MGALGRARIVEKDKKGKVPHGQSANINDE